MSNNNKFDECEECSLYRKEERMIKMEITREEYKKIAMLLVVTWVLYVGALL